MDRKQIIQDYFEGMDKKFIAQKHNVAWITVHRIIKEYKDKSKGVKKNETTKRMA